MKASKINGYYIGCRICYIIILERYMHNGVVNFGKFCELFGPHIWDKLSDDTKIGLKNLACNFKRDQMAMYEQHFGRILGPTFLKTVFMYNYENFKTFYNILTPLLTDMLPTRWLLPVSVWDMDNFLWD